MEDTPEIELRARGVEETIDEIRRHLKATAWWMAVARMDSAEQFPQYVTYEPPVRRRIGTTPQESKNDGR